MFVPQSDRISVSSERPAQQDEKHGLPPHITQGPDHNSTVEGAQLLLHNSKPSGPRQNPQTGRPRKEQQGVDTALTGAHVPPRHTRGAKGHRKNRPSEPVAELSNHSDKGDISEESRPNKTPDLNALQETGEDVRSDEKLLPLSDEEPDTRDYVSMLHEYAARKDSIVTSLHAMFEDVPGSKLKLWKCIYQAKLLPYEKGDDLLSRKAIASVKKKAKHKAAKLFLEMAKEIEDRRKRDSVAENEKAQDGSTDGNGNGDAGSAAANTKKDSEDTDVLDAANEETLRLAYSTLESMWSQGHLSEMPRYSFELVDEKWQSTVVVKTRKNGEVKLSCMAPQKKLARQRVSFLALQKLNEMEVDGAEALHSICPDRDAQRSGGVETGGGQHVASGIIGVGGCDDEARETRFGKADMEKEEVLQLPKDYAVDIAVSEEACDKWFSSFVTLGSHIGVYLDSHPARRVLGGKDRQYAAGGNSERIKRPSIFVCTENRGLFISAECRTDLDEEETEKDQYWVPGALADVLESDSVVKHGHSMTEGMLTLKDEFGVDCVQMDDVETMSLCITGLGNVEGGLFDTSIRALCGYWLQKQFPSDKSSDKSNETWLEGHPFANDLENEDRKLLTASLLSAVVCLELPKAWRGEAERKRFILHGSGEAFKDLTQKLMTKP